MAHFRVAVLTTRHGLLVVAMETPRHRVIIGMAVVDMPGASSTASSVVMLRRRQLRVEAMIMAGVRSMVVKTPDHRMRCLLGLLVSRLAMPVTGRCGLAVARHGKLQASG